MNAERIPLTVLEPCTSCGQPPEEDHDEECLLVEHHALLAGDVMAEAIHDPESCWWCLDMQPPALCTCRCGDCCRHKIIEVTLEDASREPKIREKGSPILAQPDEQGHRALIGFLLNSKENHSACVFLDQATSLCTIYGSRPLVCRLFDCDEEADQT